MDKTIKCCSRCNGSREGKMERTLNKIEVEHASAEKDGVICKHLGDCSSVQH